MPQHEFDCDECGKHIVHESTFTTGYGLDEHDHKVCYACCGKRDRQSMVATGHSRHLPLYLTSKDNNFEVVNWPGTLRFPVWGHRTSRHNIGGTRQDVWFAGPDGYVWHGVQIGEWTQICHCKRTKQLAKAA